MADMQTLVARAQAGEEVKLGEYFLLVCSKCNAVSMEKKKDAPCRGHHSVTNHVAV